MLPDLYVNRSKQNNQPQSGADAINLWHEFRNGNELAFTAIYKKYVNDLYHYGERLTPHKELIEDSIHDFFVELWKQREAYGEVTNLKFYLLKGFKYRLLKNMKKRKKLPLEFDISEDYDFEIVFSREFEWITRQVSEEQKQQVLKGINSLSRREKEIITLRFYDGLSYEEISSIMSLSIKSTYKLLYRAIDVLRKHISKIYCLLLLLLPFSR